MPESPSAASRHRAARRLAQQAQHEGDLRLLDEAIAELRQSAGPAGRPDDLAVALYHRFELTGDEPALRAAVEAYRAAVDAAGPRRVADLSGLGMCLVRLHERTGDEGAVDEAVTVLRAATAGLPADEPGVSRVWANLGLALLRRMERSGDLGPLDEAVSAHERAAATTVTAPATHAQIVANLGNTQMFAARQTGDGARLDAAVAAFRRAAGIVPAGHPALPGVFAGLADALVAKAVAAGDTALLVEANAVLDRALRHVGPADPDRPVHLNQRATALRTSFARVGDVAALDDAIACLREAVQLAPATGPDRLTYRSNLALALRNRFEYTSDRASLGEAEQLLRGVVAEVPAGHPACPTYLAELAHCLHRAGVETRAEEPLRESVELLRTAVARSPAGSPEQLLHLSNLGGTLLSLGGSSADDAVLAEGVGVLTDAVGRLDPDNFELADVLLNLGDGHRARFRRGGGREAFTAATAAYRRLAGTAQATTLHRAMAAQRLGHLHADDGDLRSARDAFRTAVGLLDLVAWLGLHRDDQERLLVEFSGLAGSAAAVAVALDDPDGALEILEQGRGVLLTRTLNLRSDADEVRVRAPVLAERLVTLHRQLESPVPGRQRLALERDAVVAQIRAVPGLAAFLEPPRVGDLRATADGRAVIVVNLSRYRCDALVLTAGATRAVPLPDLRLDDAAARVNELHRTKTAEDRDAVLPATLAWLWDTVVGPVLDAGVVPPDRPVWWVPTGPLSFLPLHAAGHPATGGAGDRSALDRVVSSYTPTVASLGRAGPGSAAAPVVFSLPETAGQPALPRAAREADLVRALFGDAVTLVPPERATRAAVLDHLAEADWVHFACHARADPSRPSDSHLVLRDGTLRIREIAGRRREGALAYLSACATAHGSARLPDESIHICTAFRLAGFTTVIGNLWEVPDAVSARATRHTYAALASSSVARAVNLAARRLRDRYPAHPSAWAGFVHIGADRSLSPPPPDPASPGPPP
ncbi:CHAT domain-containing protein [Dactylosporangium sp. NPDC005572]|uniref:CHAT domain-containing protein n=1 Tax=Dactylosporangium sp. NPDC005572 TaxID=3156889 RepID=UPI0033A9E0A2